MRGITWSRQTKALPRHILAIALLFGLVASLTGGPVLAQDEGVTGEPAVTEAPPPPPTEPPPPPTAVPTEIPAPTAVPTDVPAPTEVPATEIPPPTEIPATEVPSVVATEAPSPTPVSDPCDVPGARKEVPQVETTSTGFGSTSSDGVAYPSLTNAFTITITLPAPDACIVPNWAITMSASPMTEPGGAWIPASAITFAGVTSGPDAPVPAGTSLASPAVIVRGTDDTLAANDGILTIRVLVELSPPPGTPPGVYRGEITVDAVVVP